MKAMLLSGLIILLTSFGLGADSGEFEAVTFTVNHDPPEGQAVFLLGSLPELGGSQIRKALRMLNAEGPVWRLTVQLPAESSYSYQYFAAAQRHLCSLDATPIEPRQTGATLPSSRPRGTKLLVVRSSFASPDVWWRQDRWAYRVAPLKRVGPGRSENESTWLARFGETCRPVEFFLVDRENESRDPVSRTYSTDANAVILQDGHLFTYVPAAQVSAPRRDYEPADPSYVQSDILGERRLYRVLLPRGYDDHAARRYPVIYMHDGQIAFENHRERWNQPIDPDGRTISELIRTAQVREVIVVGVDVFDPNDNSRTRDYVPVGDVLFGVAGQSDQYGRYLIEELKRLIDSQYRTLPEREHTATIGFSSGGTVALYLAWEFPETFSRMGSWSGGFSPELEAFWARLRGSERPNVKVYLDSGDEFDLLNQSGVDLFAWNVDMRETLLGKPTMPFVLEDDLRYAYACTQPHQTHFLKTRLPGMLTFLFPGAEEPAQLLDDCNANGIPDPQEIDDGTEEDVDTDGILDICEPDCNDTGLPDDFEIAEGASQDVDSNGVPDECEADCNTNGVPDAWEIAIGMLDDCNSNGAPDECEVKTGSNDCNVWSSEDIGFVSVPGGFRSQGGWIDVLGADGRISSVTDRFHYVYVQRREDFRVTAKLSELGFTKGTSLAGLMARERLDPESPQASWLVSTRSSDIELELLQRVESGGRARTAATETIAAAEIWLRLERVGESLLVSSSVDRRNWSAPLTSELSVASEELYIGFASTCGSHEEMCTSTFCEVTVDGGGVRFLRGDCNDDGEVDISDASCLLNWLFLGGTEPDCIAVTDTNGADGTDISDATYLLNHLFLGGSPLVGPYPECRRCGRRTGRTA